MLTTRTTGAPSRLLLVVTLILAAHGAAAPDKCLECGDGAPKFPDAAEYLETQGFPADEFAVLIAWEEALPGQPGKFVTGFHIGPADGGEPFDLYRDADGILLADQDLDAMGVRPKNWQLRPVEQWGETARALNKAMHAPPTPVGVIHGIPLANAVSLPALDLAQLEAEDAAEAALSKGPRRIGAFRELSPAIDIQQDAAWESLPDGGAVWAIEIHSPDAVGQRIHFSALDVPDGGQVVVYNANAPGEAYGPYNRPYEGEADFWSPTCFAEKVVVECAAEPGVDVSDFVLIIDKISHVYVDLATLQWQKSAGSCNLDVSCYTDWSTTAKGIGGIGSIGADGSLWCTGTLLADSSPETDIPYFLTAYHCVSGQSGTYGASNIEVYWLYQTTSCGGSAPSPTTVPRTTGGADFLAGASESSGSDFAFLRLRNDPPSGPTYVGWTSDAAAVGNDVVCIHHPSGDFKRISFGAITDDGSPFYGVRLKPITRFHEVLWSDGTTEGGSSGSPLMIESTQQIIGQLWGGLASCSATDEPDYFGRFDVTFPIVQGWLAPEDSDNDGIPDITEGDGDTDGDGTPDYLDEDSDDDGIPDATEGTVDTDGDGASNYVDDDSDDDGIPDETEGAVDSDGDGTPNYIDEDSDDDGIPDETEGAVDSDGDGTPNYIDDDSDDDGISDEIEGSVDTDSDGIPNYLDDDSDDDGIPDETEGAGDPDGDTTPNFLDVDADGDGISDETEGTGDPDGDTKPNYLDDDSDDDGIPDETEGTGDPDGDGIPNYLDEDSDNDGVSDEDEAGTYDSDPYDVDTDDNGFWDGFEVDRGSDPTKGDSFPESQLFGDTNIDGEVNSQDVQLVVNGVLGFSVPVPENVLDVDDSDAVDALDIQLVIAAVLDAP